MHTRRHEPGIIVNEDESIVLDETEKYLNLLKNNAYIFNLGHGILPKTNPDIIKKNCKQSEFKKR